MNQISQNYTYNVCNKCGNIIYGNYCIFCVANHRNKRKKNLLKTTLKNYRGT